MSETLDNAVRTYIENHRAAFLDDLAEWLRIPSVSAQPEHGADVLRSAEWLAAKLRETGFPVVEIWPTDGAPAVFASWPSDDADAPTALVYGHHDVQPAAREDGRHRRWTPRDVALLEEMCRLTGTGVPPGEAARAAQHAFGHPAQAAPRLPVPAQAPRPGAAGSGLPLGTVRQECRGLARAAVRLDAPAVEARLALVVERLGTAAAWEEVMAPALRAVGRKWETAGERYVEVEHLLSWHVSSALRRVPPAPATTGPPVLLACVPEEQHALPVEALAAGRALALGMGEDPDRHRSGAPEGR